MDNITQNGFDHSKFGANASILVLIPHKFGDNVSNLVLMLKKIGGEDHYNLFFLKSCVYVRLGEHQENLQREPLAFFFLKLLFFKIV
jgi:hypothetical protein